MNENDVGDTSANEMTPEQPVEEQARDQTGQQRIRVHVDEKNLKTSYANVFRPTATAEELILALESGVGRIVVDNFHELELLGEIARERGCIPDILLRISPGVDPHTHKYLTTGNIDSKFGIPMVLAEKAVETAMSMSGLNPVGLHFHIGSQIA